MIIIEKIKTFNFEGAIRGMRNPLNSWDRSDSVFTMGDSFVGVKDLELMHKLYKAGTEHSKYLRQIFIIMDITAPLYWWKEFDTYKVGTVANSCSTMHRLTSRPLTIDDFSHEHLLVEMPKGVKTYSPYDILVATIETINDMRTSYVDTKDKTYWWQMIQLLPSSYNQKRTITMTYANAVCMIEQRTNHKLDEWNDFVEVLNDLPYMKEIKGFK